MFAPALQTVEQMFSTHWVELTPSTYKMSLPRKGRKGLVQCPIACKEWRNCGQLDEGLNFSVFNDVLLVPQISSRQSYRAHLKEAQNS